MRELPLPKGLVALVDDEDYDDLCRFRWHVSRRRGGAVYVMRDIWRGGHTREYLHRRIMQPAPGQTVDHVNGDPFDNRRANLRLCTQAENCRNVRKKAVARPYKGVRPTRNGRRYVAEIGHDGTTHYLGTFDTAEAAARAYDAEAMRVFGSFARPNLQEIR